MPAGRQQRPGRKRYTRIHSPNPTADHANRWCQKESFAEKKQIPKQGAEEKLGRNASAASTRQQLQEATEGELPVPVVRLAMNSLQKQVWIEKREGPV